MAINLFQRYRTRVIDTTSLTLRFCLQHTTALFASNSPTQDNPDSVDRTTFMWRYFSRGKSSAIHCAITEVPGKGSSLSSEALNWTFAVTYYLFVGKHGGYWGRLTRLHAQSFESPFIFRTCDWSSPRRINQFLLPTSQGHFKSTSPRIFSKLLKFPTKL